MPREDVFTIFHLLELLQSDASTRVLLDHPAFKYSRISRQRVDADEILSVEEEQQLDQIRDAMGKTRNAKELKTLQAEIDAILAQKRDALKFIPDQPPDGYLIANLVFHETQPNVSIRVRKSGTVDLTTCYETMPASVVRQLDTWAVPTFATHVWRNYAIVANGLINIEKLPVKISRALKRRLASFDVSMVEMEGGVTVIDLRPIPILNRAMVNGVSMAEAAQLEFELTRSRAFQKVYKAVVQDNFPEVKAAASFVERYEAEGAAWLKEQGLTENGFTPRQVVADSSDYITGRELQIKLAGYSTLPPVDRVNEKRARKAKLNGPETLMAEALDEIEHVIKTHARKAHARNSGLAGMTPETITEDVKKWLIERMVSLVTETRALILRAARMKFAITVGQAWFREFKSLDENTLEVQINKVGAVKATAELREIQIKI